jgi:anti-sigma factor RsiW
MNHQELKDLLPLYVLGGLEVESVAAVEQHLAAVCESCTAELREWQEVVGLIPLGVIPDGPRAAVKERLMARVRQGLGDVPGAGAQCGLLYPWPQLRLSC